VVDQERTAEENQIESETTLIIRIREQQSESTISVLLKPDEDTSMTGAHDLWTMPTDADELVRPDKDVPT
jgi:hypothetical protein